jgi:hypothetical protein
MIDGRPRPDHGPGQVEHACACGAGWVGAVDEVCWWCAQAEARQRGHYRRELLWPAWMVEQGPRYDDLSPLDRALWDAARGIDRGEHSRRAWARRLGQAVTAGLITRHEARAALARARRRRAD